MTAASPAEETIVVAKYNRVEARFAINNKADVIQKCLAGGSFYEPEELAYIAEITPPRSHILDVGANIGNHTVFFAMVRRVAKVIPFEANPQAVALLRRTCELNALANVDLSHLGLAVSDKEGWVAPDRVQANNIGSQSFKPSAETPNAIRAVPIDSLGIAQADFIKIDVEGMELPVLNGMSQLIQRWRPLLFVEVARVRMPSFHLWLQSNNYRIDRSFQRYYNIFNFACFPNY